MDQTPPPPAGMPGMAASSPAPQLVPPPVQRVFSSTPEQRARWAAQKRNQKARKAGLPAPPAQVPLAPPPLNPAPAAGVPVAAVPWNSAPLKPVCEAVINAWEKVNVSSLKAKAEEVSPELALMVAQDAPWNPKAKAALEASSPEALAKVLNRLGISAENGPEAIALAALVSIVAGQWMLSSKIDEAIAKKEKAKTPPAVAKVNQ